MIWCYVRECLLNWESSDVSSVPFAASVACAIYYYVPVSILVISNLILLALTLNRIKEQEKELGLYLDTVNSRRHNYNRGRFVYDVEHRNPIALRKSYIVEFHIVVFYYENTIPLGNAYTL